MKEIKSFPATLKEKFKTIGINVKLAFLYATCSTFISHIVYFINRWANEDDFHEVLGQVNMIGSGRWMPGTILSSEFLSPIILLLIVIIFMSLISAMITSMFKIKKKTYIFIVSLLLTTFPVLAFGYGYGFMVERYTLGMFFAVLSVFITDKYKLGAIGGAISLAITMGYYQSYIGIAIGLILLLIILNTTDNKSFKDNIKYIIKFLIMGIAGIILYMILTKLVCHFSNVQLLDYKGINKMGSLPPFNQIIPLLKRTYLDFINFYIGKKFISPFNYGLIAQVALCLINFILIIIIIIKNKIYKNKINIILLISLIILIPLGFNIVDFMAFESETSSLNIYQFIFILLGPFILLSKIDLNIKFKNKNMINIIEWIGCVLGLALIWNNIVITNIYYLKINDFYTSTVQLTNRIYDRIEQMPDFNGETKVMLGNKKGIYMDRRIYKTYYTKITYDQGLWDQFIGYAPRPTGTDFKFHYLVQSIIGVHLYSATPEKYEEIYNSSEYEEMASWPHKDCMKYIDDILVVKIS